MFISVSYSRRDCARYSELRRYFHLDKLIVEAETLRPRTARLLDHVLEPPARIGKPV